MDQKKCVVTCNDTQGTLPACGMLAAAYVPIQQQNPKKYGDSEALRRGTLFPGLDLPWMNAVNTPNSLAGTPLGELMALCFVVQELGLYLDTHSADQEALKLYTEYVKLLDAGKATYTQRYGPLTQMQVSTEGYSWLDDPWPWEYGGSSAALPEGGSK